MLWNSSISSPKAITLSRYQRLLLSDGSKNLCTSPKVEILHFTKIHVFSGTIGFWWKLVIFTKITEIHGNWPQIPNYIPTPSQSGDLNSFSPFLGVDHPPTLFMISTHRGYSPQSQPDSGSVCSSFGNTMSTKIWVCQLPYRNVVPEHEH